MDLTAMRPMDLDRITELIAGATKPVNVHYRTPDGAEKVAVIREGEILHCPAGTPHSPRFPTDAYVLVLERKRRAGEHDRAASAGTWRRVSPRRWPGSCRASRRTRGRSSGSA